MHDCNTCPRLVMGGGTDASPDPGTNGYVRCRENLLDYDPRAPRPEGARLMFVRGNCTWILYDAARLAETGCPYHPERLDDLLPKTVKGRARRRRKTVDFDVGGDDE
jgi:hypothetical protein